MNVSRTYLDYNATAPLLPAARGAVVSAMDATGNPSSVHGEGRAARKIVEDAREKVAALVGAKATNVVFTSGATEANAWALSRGWDRIFLPKIEHDSVLAPVRLSGAEIVEIAASEAGQTCVEQIGEHVLTGAVCVGRQLVTLQIANNETGVLQPVTETAEFCKEHGLALHVDGVQGAGRTSIEFEALGAETMAVSSHKIGGPLGVGALILKDGIEISPLIVGGGQEKRRRAGTENVAGIAGFGAAAEVALNNLNDMTRLQGLRDRLEQQLLSVTPAARIIGAEGPRLANTTCVAVEGQSSEILLIKFDLAGIAVSSGSACSSGKVGASHVLTAMGINSELSRSAIRVSLGWDTSAQDIDTFVSAWSEFMAGRSRAVA